MAAGTHERIMDAALRLLAERGATATPVTAIEAGAGLSAPPAGVDAERFTAMLARLLINPAGDGEPVVRR